MVEPLPVGANAEAKTLADCEASAEKVVSSVSIAPELPGEVSPTAGSEANLSESGTVAASVAESAEPVPSGQSASGLAKEEFWRAAIQEQTASGLSIRAFCLAQGLPCGSFYRWKTALLLGGPAGVKAANGKARGFPAEGQAPATVPGGNDTAQTGVGHEVADGAATVSPDPESLPGKNPKPRFVEVRLNGQSDLTPAVSVASALVIRHGEFTLEAGKDCDRALLQDVLGMLRDRSC